MTYIKRLVMKGFKSFARETKLELDPYMNIIVGPNGSGKSNVTDALCFVLGRLSVKSMRAAKASHLIFAGTQNYKKANLAYVEIVWDNSDKTFAIENEEIKIRRIVKKNGQSVYKINNQTKTRQEVLELLSQAGVDPHGFNIILQGEIERFVKMPAEERRKVLEEVAGISVYEMRKAKSLKELGKTEEKIKQVNAVLRERTNYLKNLENEREQALRFKKSEESIKRCKASIIHRNIKSQEAKLNENNKEIEKKNKDIAKKDAEINSLQNKVNSLNEKANHIAKTIQESSGLEQDSLNNEISDLKQELGGLSARKENYENQINELNRRRQALEESVELTNKEIKDMSKEKSQNLKINLDEKKEKLEELDELKRQYFLLKSNTSSLENQLQNKKREINRNKNNSNYVINEIEQLEKEINFNENLEHQRDKLLLLKNNLEKFNKEIIILNQKILEDEKACAMHSQKIKEAENIKDQVSKLDICPLCKSQITKEHINKVKEDSENKISISKKFISETENKIKENNKKLEELKEKISQSSNEINNRELDIVKIKTINDKKQQLKRNNEELSLFENELKNIEKKKKTNDNNLSKISLSEEQYEKLRLEVQELQRTQERNLGAEITAKQRELDRTKLALKQNKRDKELITEDLKEINENLEEKQDLVEEKEKQAEILKNKYQKMFDQKNRLQDEARKLESELLKIQNNKRYIESEINNLKILKAQISAKKDSFLEEIKEFQGVEIISGNIEKLKEKLYKSQEVVARIGNVNMRALEVYDDIKKEYDKIKEKIEQLETEKMEILKIISQIDRRKRKVFLKTLEEINNLFSNNFSQLSAKGIVLLEPKDKKDIFGQGLDIVVKIGGKKSFDVTSLSGGEQTLVALSLIFSIQEYRPYCFYIFDEIDAALDKNNSQKLVYLLRKHMKQGQYLIITHNDSLISESSNVLYGVSMQEGISKVLSLEI